MRTRQADLSLPASYTVNCEEPVNSIASMAAAAVGAIGGFLAGLPRYTAAATIPPIRRDEAAKAAEATTVAVPARIFGPSNNLEQISDWLTKLLIGAGLVQLGSLGGGLSRIVRVIATSSVGQVDEGSFAAARVVAGSVLTYYGIVGFLSFYLAANLSYLRTLTRYVQSVYLEQDAPGT